MISKLKRPEEGGGRLAIVFNGSPLFTGRRGLGRERDPPLDHRERLARGHRRPARPALLQHRHQHLLLDRHQPQAPRAPRQGPARRRARVVRQDAQEPGQQAQRDQRRADRRDHPALRRLRGERAGQDPAQRVVRLPAHHGRTAAAPAVRGDRGDAAGDRGVTRLEEADRARSASTSSAARPPGGRLLDRPSRRSPERSARCRRRSRRPSGRRSRSAIPKRR